MKKLWKIYDLSLIFIVLAVSLSVLAATYSIVLAAAQLVLVIGFALAKYIYHIEVKEKLLYKVKTVTDELNFEQGKAFEVLSVPCVVIEENGDIIWLNESFRSTFNITLMSSFCFKWDSDCWKPQRKHLPIPARLSLGISCS